MRHLAGILALVISMLVLPAMAAVQPDLKQETIGYCEARAHLALTIVKAMEDGTPIENINVAFQQAPPTPELEQAREDWVAALKVEISAAMTAVPRDKDEWAQRVAQKVIEKCWYDYGKKRIERQSALPSPFVRTASSEAIAKSPRTQECSELLVDQVFIGNMLGSGRATVDELRTLALQSEQMLGAERFQKVLALIDEAEKSLKQSGGIQAWFDNYWHACVDGAH